MGDTLHCPDCETEIDSADDLETSSDVPEVDVEEDGSFSLFENRDLFLCKSCKRPLGVGRSK